MSSNPDPVWKHASDPWLTLEESKSLVHELKTPFNGVVGMSASLMTSKDLPVELKSELGHLKRVGDRLLEFVEHSFDHALLSKGSLRTEAKQVDIALLVEESVSMLQYAELCPPHMSSLDHHPIKREAVVLSKAGESRTPVFPSMPSPPMSPLTVTGHEASLAHMLHSVIELALKNTSEGQVSVEALKTKLNTVQVTLTADGGFDGGWVVGGALAVSRDIAVAHGGSLSEENACISASGRRIDRRSLSPQWGCVIITIPAATKTILPAVSSRVFGFGPLSYVPPSPMVLSPGNSPIPPNSPAISPRPENSVSTPRATPRIGGLTPRNSGRLAGLPLLALPKMPPGGFLLPVASARPTVFTMRQALGLVSVYLVTSFRGVLGMSEALLTKLAEHKGLVKQVGLINRCAAKILSFAQGIFDACILAEAGDAAENGVLTKEEARKSPRLSELPKLVLNWKNIYIQNIIEVLLRDFSTGKDRRNQQPFKKDEVSIFNEVEGNLPAIPGDESLVTKAISHLLENAFKFTNKGHVRVFSSVRKKIVNLTVEDTGSYAVSTAEYESIFKPFARLESQKIPGLGLGLTVVYGVMKLLSGTINVSKSAKGGLSVTLTFTRGDVKRTPDFCPIEELIKTSQQAAQQSTEQSAQQESNDIPTDGLMGRNNKLKFVSNYEEETTPVITATKTHAVESISPPLEQAKVEIESKKADQSSRERIASVEAARLKIQENQSPNHQAFVSTMSEDTTQKMQAEIDKLQETIRRLRIEVDYRDQEVKYEKIDNEKKSFQIHMLKQENRGLLNRMLDTERKVRYEQIALQNNPTLGVKMVNGKRVVPNLSELMGFPDYVAMAKEMKQRNANI